MYFFIITYNDTHGCPVLLQEVSKVMGKSVLEAVGNVVTEINSLTVIIFFSKKYKYSLYFSITSCTYSFSLYGILVHTFKKEDKIRYMFKGSCKPDIQNLILLDCFFYAVLHQQNLVRRVSKKSP